MGRRVIAAASVALAAAGPVPAAIQSPQTPPVFRGTTHVVSRDVNVHDGKGRFVSNLRREDFRVFEDGVEQTIEGFARVMNGVVRADGPPPPAASSGGVILPPRAATESGRIVIVFIDDLHLQARLTPRARQVLAQFRDEVLRDDDQIVMVSSGYSSIALNLRPYPGRERFDAEIAKLLGSGSTAQELLSTPDTAEGPAEVRHRVAVTFKAAYMLLEQLETIRDRRKAFVWVSSGYDFNPYPETRLAAERERLGLPKLADPSTNPFDKPGQTFSEADLMAQLSELGRAAVRANTRLYTVDPRGLVAGPDIDSPVTINDARANLTTTTESLRALADLTGGRAAVHINDFKSFFRGIDQALSDYYVIRYTSTNTDPQRRTRRVEIRVSRPGVTLTYPETYSIRSR